MAGGLNPKTISRKTIVMRKVAPKELHGHLYTYGQNRDSLSYSDGCRFCSTYRHLIDTVHNKTGSKDSVRECERPFPPPNLGKIAFDG